MRQSFRKTVAQAGVVLFITQMLASNVGYLVFLIFGQFSIVLYILPQLGTILLVVAAILPSNNEDVWGSMWPLVGYDNAIDGIYARGPWLLRYQELEDEERERRVTNRMTILFGES